jgi:hypothetical protein
MELFVMMAIIMAFIVFLSIAIYFGISEFFHWVAMVLEPSNEARA